MPSDMRHGCNSVNVSGLCRKHRLLLCVALACIIMLDSLVDHAMISVVVVVGFVVDVVVVVVVVVITVI